MTTNFHRNPLLTPSIPLLVQWANGRVIGKCANDASFHEYVGWHVEQGKDESFDDFARHHMLPTITIQHSRHHQTVIVNHWHLGSTVRLFPLTLGPVVARVVQCFAPEFFEQTLQAGIGIRWEPPPIDQSRMAIWGYVAVLPPHQQQWELYPTLVQISARSRMTEKLLAALIAHMQVCAAADTLQTIAQSGDHVAYHDLALPLKPGQEERWGTKTVSTVTPFVSGHPSRKSINEAYLRSIWRPEMVARLAEQDWKTVQHLARSFASVQRIVEFPD